MKLQELKDQLINKLQSKGYIVEELKNSEDIIIYSSDRAYKVSVNVKYVHQMSAYSDIDDKSMINLLDSMILDIDTQFNEIISKKETGLCQNYIVHKADGSPVDPEAEFFVLRLDNKQKDRIHAQACREAILAYAFAIKFHLPKLYDDLIKKYQ